MKHFTGSYSRHDRYAGIVATLALHAFVLYGLWSYRIIPPPSEALTVFVNFIAPQSPARVAEPAAPKPPRPAQPVRQEAPRSVAPAAPQMLVSAAPATSPAQTVAPPPPVTRTPPPPAPVSTFVPPGATAAPVTAAAPQPVQLSGELSVACPERTPPAYPKQSLRLGEQGKTLLLVELDEAGQVAKVTVKAGSGFSRLDEAAIAAVKSWRCTPARRNGVAVRSVALQPFNFAIKGR